MIQWYPGHMAKAKKEIEEKLRLVDVVYELIDARIPVSSRNPMINEILKNKPRVILMTKSNMADPIETKKWESYFKSSGQTVLAIDSIEGFNVKKIIPISRELLKEKFQKEALKGLKPRPIRGMIIGIPNVGKSTLLNKLVGKKVANVGNKPGVTKAQQWVRLNKDLDLLDTPGVLWPKFEDEKVGIHLALTGAIKDELLKVEDLGNYLINFLKNKYCKEFVERYNINIDEDNIKIVEDICKSRGNIQSIEDGYRLIIQDFRNARIGKITLDLL